MKLVNTFSTSIIMGILLVTPFSTANAENAQEEIQPQVGTTNVNELMTKAGTFYYKNFIAGTKDDCNDKISTCTYNPDPHNITHNLRVNVKGQTKDIYQKEIMIKHLGEDILTNQTSSKPETRYTSVHAVTKIKSKSTTVDKGFVLPHKIGNVIVAADILGVGRVNLPFDFNKSETISDSESETTSTSPQPYTVQPNQVIKVITELYALEYDGSIAFTAEAISNADINVAIDAKGGVCKGTPGGVICVNKDRTFNKDFTILYDNLNNDQKQKLENSGMYMNTKVPGEKKLPFFKGEGSFTGIGGHRVVTKDYDITDPNNPKLVNVRSQDI
ncbi:ETX/MTX2 family pore-forming toxin [Candidatus Enterococcus ikei]|uniref:ETX/MTX2 family pore-forming toxin n=1 Tax=Candidatus Enterococcus ikei TaxID=2815326 RepID=A0ABS3GWR4_9ENTE|nr:ETX/MTX2 family pore-forming toxin [Enterococcus sp. DIV0869a]MBO0439699.1 ETX/MTX2 family pore-forming toxin [Enterococcus sp. DIV0869a]